MHAYSAVEVASLILLPSILINNNISFFYCFMAGWNIGLFSPNVGLQHEWLHIDNKKWYTKILFELTSAFYLLGLQMVHHKNSHHRYANTNQDYGHPRKNINKLHYIMEYTVLHIPKLIKHNKYRVLTSVVLFLLINVCMYTFFGFTGLLFHLGAFIGFQYTAVSGNYVQHYGLETLPIPDSEKVVFAWDDSGVIGKYTHFNLHIHSDHHSNALKSFDKLRNIKGRPLLPYSLPAMMLLFPFPIFEKIMNKRLEVYCEKILKERTL